MGFCPAQIGQKTLALRFPTVVGLEYSATIKGRIGKLKRVKYRLGEKPNGPCSPDARMGRIQSPGRLERDT
jgi:hypothetical protein